MSAIGVNTRRQHSASTLGVNTRRQVRRKLSAHHVFFRKNEVKKMWPDHATPRPLRQLCTFRRKSGRVDPNKRDALPVSQQPSTARGPRRVSRSLSVAHPWSKAGVPGDHAVLISWTWPQRQREAKKSKRRTHIELSISILSINYSLIYIRNDYIFGPSPLLMHIWESIVDTQNSSDNNTIATHSA